MNTTPTREEFVTMRIQFAVQLTREGAFEQAVFRLRDALRAAPHNPVLLDVCQQVLAQVPNEPHFTELLGEIHHLRGNFAEAQKQYWSVIQRAPTPGGSQIAATVAASRLAMQGLKPPPLMLIACAPKSGSTFLSTVLGQATGLGLQKLVYAYHDNAQDLYLPALIDAWRNGGVVQQHMNASMPNVSLLQEYGIKTVVLVRDIFDTAVSIRDHLIKDKAFGPVLMKAHAAFDTFDSDTQIDFVINHCMPWYFQFYATWDNISRKEVAPTLWITYEEMIANPTATMQTIATYYGLTLSQEACEQALADSKEGGEKTRFNKGVAGRGQSLSERHRNAIRSFAHYYPGVDFGRMGIAS